MRSVAGFAIAVLLLCALPAVAACPGEGVEFEVVTEGQLLSYFRSVHPICESAILDYRGLAPGRLRGFTPEAGSFDIAAEVNAGPHGTYTGAASATPEEMVFFFHDWNVFTCEASIATWLGHAGQPVVCFEPLGNKIAVGFPTTPPPPTCEDQMAALERLVIAALPNSLAADVVTITAGAEGSTNLADRLKNLYPWDFARLTSVLPEESHWTVDVGSTPLTGVRALGLGGHTLIPGDQVRAVTVASGSLPDVVTEQLAPDAIVDSDNAAAGADIADVQDHPSASDNDYIFPDLVASPWSLLLSFPTPAAAPAVETDCQVFLLRARMNGAGGQPDDYPTVTVSVAEGGVVREVIGTRIVQDQNLGGVLIFPWSASNLQTADGSAVQILLEFEPGSSSTSVQLNSVSWEVLSQADYDAADYATDWHTIAGAEPSADWGNTAVQEIDLPPPLWHVFLPAAITVSKARFEIRGDGVGYFDDFLHTPPRTPAEAIDAGYLIVSHAFEVPFNFAAGGRLRSVPTYVGGESALNGSNNQVVQYVRREFEAEFTLREDQAATLFERLDYAARGRSFLVAIQPGATGTLARNTTFLATVADFGGHSFERPMRNGQTTRGTSYRFVESL